MSEGGLPVEQTVPVELTNYRELRESLERLGEAESGLVVKLTREGKPGVVVLPPRNNRSSKEASRDPITDWTVAVADDGIRVITMVPPKENWVVEGQNLGEYHSPVTGIIESVAARNGSEEDVIEAIIQGGGFAWTVKESGTGRQEESLLKALYLRNERLMMDAYGQNVTTFNPARGETLSNGFDWYQRKPEESLTQRFNQLADSVRQLPPYQPK